VYLGLDTSNQNHICSCNHLTDFTVLYTGSPGTDTQSSSETLIIVVASSVGGAFVIVIVISIIGYYRCYRKGKMFKKDKIVDDAIVRDSRGLSLNSYSNPTESTNSSINTN